MRKFVPTIRDAIQQGVGTTRRVVLAGSRSELEHGDRLRLANSNRSGGNGVHMVTYPKPLRRGNRGSATVIDSWPQCTFDQPPAWVFDHQHPCSSGVFSTIVTHRTRDLRPLTPLEPDQRDKQPHPLEKRYVLNLGRSHSSCGFRDFLTESNPKTSEVGGGTDG